MSSSISYRKYTTESLASKDPRAGAARAPAPRAARLLSGARRRAPAGPAGAPNCNCFRQSHSSAEIVALNSLKITSNVYDIPRDVSNHSEELSTPLSRTSILCKLRIEEALRLFSSSGYFYKISSQPRRPIDRSNGSSWMLRASFSSDSAWRIIITTSEDAK